MVGQVEYGRVGRVVESVDVKYAGSLEHQFYSLREIIAKS